jgi:methyl-accepting chemotaxis protein PixJ
VVDDVYNGGLTDCHVEALENFGVKSCMVVSIFQGKKLWGLLSAFQHSGPRHWQESEVKWLSQIAAQLG